MQSFRIPRVNFKKLAKNPFYKKMLKIICRYLTPENVSTLKIIIFIRTSEHQEYNNFIK